MKRDHFDIVFACWPRLSGDALEAVATEITAAAKAGFRVGLQLFSESRGRGRPDLPRELMEAIRLGSARSVGTGSKVDCELLVLHASGIPLAAMRSQIPLVGFGLAVVVVSDVSAAREMGRGRLAEAFAEKRRGSVWIAPAGPNIRNLLEPTDADLRLAPEDWRPLIDLERWPARQPCGFGDPVIIIGRHDLGPGSWPSERSDILAAYPDDPRFEIRVLGGAADAMRTLAKLPGNWRLALPGASDRRAFLHGLDAYVYFPSGAQLEPVGRNLLEAMATALPIVLPPVFAPLLGDAALYSAPKDVAGLLLDLQSSEAATFRRSILARLAVEDFFSSDRFATRLRNLFGLTPRSTAGSATASPARGAAAAAPDPVEEVAIRFGATPPPAMPLDPAAAATIAIDPPDQGETDRALPAGFELPPADATGFLDDGDEALFSADLYIVALARSGSAFLSDLLTVPPSCWVMQEPWFMYGATTHELYQQAVRFGWQLTEKDWSLPMLHRNKGTMLRRYRDLLAPRLAELQKWGAKEIRPQFHAPTIATLRPKKIVVLTRDVGDAYLSFLELNRRHNPGRHSERWTYQYFHLAARELVRLVQQFGAGHRLRIMRYEELLSEQSRSRLADWLDWPMSGDAERSLRLRSREYEVERHRGGGASPHLSAEARGLPAFVDQWADQLRRDCHDYQERFGF